MTNAELIQAIRNEIERRKKALHSTLFNDEYNDLLSFLDTLESEKPMNKDCNGCPHCVDRKDQYGWHFKGCFGGPYNGKFIAEIDECPLKQEQPEVDSEKPIPADLEEAAEKEAIEYAEREKPKDADGEIWKVGDVMIENRMSFKDGFIAGAKWDRIQMMKEAVKWLVDEDYYELTDKGRFILGSVGIGYNGYYIPYSDLLKLPKEELK